MRRRVLRPHQPPEASAYPDDDAAGSAHWGAFVTHTLVGVASIYAEPFDGSHDSPDWRIRGMATVDQVRGQGMGLALLAECIAYVRSQNGKGIWCNARTTACGFYERSGFTRRGGEFEIEGIGSHFVMQLLLS